MNTKRIAKKALRLVLVLFLLLNVVAYFHAYSFTHFSDTNRKRTAQSPTFAQKLRIVFTGIDNPRPANAVQPTVPFETITVQSNERLHCWLLKKDGAKGTVVLFHGYGGEKSSMLDKAYCFLNLGYNAVLVDFAGSGGSGGKKTTVGYHEAQEVKDCFDYLQNAGHRNIVLFGTSMGAAAIMKAIADHAVQPSSAILECPFGTMHETVKARFKMLGIPSFPMAGLLVFGAVFKTAFGLSRTILLTMQ